MCQQSVTVQKCTAPGCTVDDSIYYEAEQCDEALERCPDCPCDNIDAQIIETVDGYLCAEHGGSGSLAD